MNLNKEENPRLVPSASNDWEHHPTSLEAYLACKRKHYFQSIMGLTPKDSMIHFHFGSSFHAGVGIFYSVRGMDVEEAVKLFDPDTTYDDETLSNPFLLAKTMSVKAFAETWATKEVYPSEKRNLSTGMVALGKYCDGYENDEVSFSYEMIETPLRISMPNGTTLTMTIDRVSRIDDYTIVADTKTSGWALTNWFWVNYENSFQLGMYNYGVEQVLGRCDAVQIDAILVPYVNENSIQRRSWTFSDMQRDSFLNTYIQATDEIKDTLSKYEVGSEECLNKFPCSQVACGGYGGCKFLPICKYGFDHPSIKSAYEIGDVV